MLRLIPSAIRTGLSGAGVYAVMVPDLSMISAPTRAECAAVRRRGELDLQTAAGRAQFGLAFLRVATEAQAPPVD